MDSFDSATDIEDRRPPALPAPAIAAVLGGCAILVFAGIGLPHLIARPPANMMFACGAAAALLLWIVAIPLGLRHASLLWKLAGLGVLIVAGLGGALIADRFYNASASGDASSFAEAEIAADGSLSLPRGAAGRGPLSKRYVQMLEQADSDRRSFEAQAGRVNIGVLNSPYLLDRDPAVLQDCGAIGKIGASARAQADKEIARNAAMRAAIESSGLSPALRDGIARMAAPQTREESNRMTAIKTSMFESTEALCRLLARRSWRNQDGRFAFGDSGDMARMREIDDARREAAAQTGAIAHEIRARMESGQQAVRDELSR